VLLGRCVIGFPRSEPFLVWRGEANGSVQGARVFLNTKRRNARRRGGGVQWAWKAQRGSCLLLGGLPPPPPRVRS
jgi:hypothetical protein